MKFSIGDKYYGRTGVATLLCRITDSPSYYYSEYKMLKQVLLDHSPLPNIKYIDRYIRFIDSCKGRAFTKPLEHHHIIPKSFGGKNGDNIIVLSARHHYIAHLILAKATGSPKMIKALHKMVYSRTGDVSREYKITSRVYSFLRTEHSKIVSSYSKNTVTAKHIYTGEIKRIPKKLFDKYNNVLYIGVAKGRKDTPDVVEAKRAASRKPRKVKQGTRIRSVSASKYSYDTPKGYCENRQDLLRLYPTFTKNTLNVIKDDLIISSKFASIHTEFKSFIGKTMAEIGFKRIMK